MTIAMLISLALLSSTASAEQPCDIYFQLVAKSEAGDTIDYQQLRFAGGDCDPEREVQTSIKEYIALALKMGKYSEAIELGLKALKQNYLDLEIHRALSVAYKEFGNSEAAVKHRKIREGLLKSILDSGDGKSPQSAYVVDRVGEEYAVLEALGLPLTMQGLIYDSETGSAFDVFTYAAADGTPNRVYFNIDRHMNRRRKVREQSK